MAHAQNRLDSPLRNLPARFDSGFEVTARLPLGSLPGRVLVSPPVWLCCVYPAVRQADRINRNHEFNRLDKLLQAATSAWRNHTSTNGSLARHCVFPYDSGDSDDAAERLPIRVELIEERPNRWTTRLELAA